MGLCNLKYIDMYMAERKRRWDIYKCGLKNIEGIRFFKENIYSTTNYGYFPILIGKDYSLTRNGLYTHLRKQNIYARKYFYPLTTKQVCYKNKYSINEYEVAQKMAEQILVLPLYSELEIDKIEKVIEVIKCKDME